MLPPHDDVPEPFSTNLSFPLSFFFVLNTDSRESNLADQAAKQRQNRIVFFLASNPRMQSIVSLGGELSMGKCFGKRATEENGRRG